MNEIGKKICQHLRQAFLCLAMPLLGIHAKILLKKYAQWAYKDKHYLQLELR